MDDSSGPETPPALADIAAAEGCRKQLTRTNSVSSSVTANNSKDFIHQSASARRVQGTAWTDEKHNSYIHALEASFVKQLHHSLGLPSWRLKQDLLDSDHYPSDQFQVLQNGHSCKINFVSSHPLLYSAAGSHVVSKIPWQPHSGCSGEHSSTQSVNSRECNMFPSDAVLLRGKRIISHGLKRFERQCLCRQCYQDALTNSTEVSDQNFVDEGQEENSSRLFRGKRLKIPSADASTEDQTVPSGNCFSAKVSTSKNSSEREEQVHHNCLSENIEILFCSGPDAKPFLRES